MSDSKSSKIKKTPLMTQYDEIKRHHPNDLLLFRMGDFYELFNEDARKASKALNITLTQRNKKSGDDTPMCGFPHHSMEAPVNRLLDQGFSVAICDQLEDPSEAKGIVKRGVTLMLSPGVVFNTSQLDQNKRTYILSFDKNKISWMEPSTGRAFYVQRTDEQHLERVVQKIEPKEILISSEAQKADLTFFRGNIVKSWERAYLKDLVENKKYDPSSLLIEYVRSMQGEEGLFGFTDWKEIESQTLMKTNTQFFRHLEVFESNERLKEKSLFHSLKKTKSPGGTRLLREWLENPLVDVNIIQKRQTLIKSWLDDYSYLEEFRSEVSEMGDFERRISRAGHTLSQPQDLIRLKNSLHVFLKLDDKKNENLEELYRLLDESLVEEAVANWQTKGGYIKKGFSDELDELIDTSVHAQSMIQDLEMNEKKKTGITSLKIRFNSVFGYYIEVTKTHKDRVPERYVRKQTLTNAERYWTEELSDIEEKVLSAKSKRVLLEKKIFEDLKDEVRKSVVNLKKASDLINTKDVASSLAYLMIEKNYCLPDFQDEKKCEVIEGFHPVVADELRQSGSGVFVTNNLKLDKESSFLLITGPNMAGKSTLMRQMAITSFLAQCGLPCPAASAHLHIYDGIYSRIGASDILSEGLSTFMVEMTETSSILNSATENSLLILDEIGRGTSSQDGKVLAQSIVQHIISKIGAHCLFATHYHELSKVFLENEVRNIHLGYQEKKGKIEFTYKIKEGPSEKSYGIEVAELAGIPKTVVEEAQRLNQNESFEIHDKTARPIEPHKKGEGQQLEFLLEESEFIEELKSLDLNSMTPLEALAKINQWQENFS